MYDLYVMGPSLIGEITVVQIPPVTSLPRIIT